MSCAVYCLCIMCNVLLPPGVNPITVNKYIVSYISYLPSPGMLRSVHCWLLTDFSGQVFGPISGVKYSLDCLILEDGARYVVPNNRHMNTYVLYITPQKSEDLMYILIYHRTCNETNLMHCVSSVYSVTIPLHVSGLLSAHHLKVTMCICATIGTCQTFQLTVSSNQAS
jgi:hypothetical protein